MDRGKPDKEREGPRAQAAVEVDVEVAGEKQKVRLTTKDIGAGGMFLQTEKPAALWKRVKLAFELADGKRFEVGGEVVRTLPPDKAKEKSQPAGMAVAFDEVSRPRRKQLLDLVLELCTRRPAAAVRAAPPAAVPPKLPPQPAIKMADDTDKLLEELDALIDSVDGAQPVQQPKAAKPEPSEVSIEIELPEDEPPAPKPAPASPGQIDTIRKALQQYSSERKGDNHYQVLLLPLDAGAAQIDRAYRDLLARLQLDGPADGLPADLRGQLSAALGRIRKAYAILSKPDRKRAYDFLIDNMHEDL